PPALGQQDGRTTICRRRIVRDGATHAQKNKLKPWLKEEWVIPPGQNAEFVSHMEDVLDVYCRPYDSRRPQVCLDEMSRQLLADTREPLPPAPGRPRRRDCEYKREGTVNMFMCCEPLSGWRHVAVTERRTRVDLGPRSERPGGRA